MYKYIGPTNVPWTNSCHSRKKLTGRKLRWFFTMRFIHLLLLWPIVQSIALPTPPSNTDGSAADNSPETEAENQNTLSDEGGGGNPLLESIGGLAATRWVWNRVSGVFKKKQPPQTPQTPSSAPKQGLGDKSRGTPELQNQADAKAPQPPSGSASGPFSRWRNRFIQNSRSTTPSPNGGASRSGQFWFQKNVQKTRPEPEVASEQPPQKPARVLTSSEKGSQMMTPEDLKPFLDDEELNRLKTCMMNHEVSFRKTICRGHPDISLTAPGRPLKPCWLRSVRSCRTSWLDRPKGEKKAKR